MRSIPFLVAGVISLSCGGDQVPVSAEETRTCLKDADFNVQGPVVRESDDSDAPDQTLVVSSSGRGSGAYIGWYGAEARADRYASKITEHAKNFRGSVDRHGRLTIIWLRGQNTDEAGQIRDCALEEGFSALLL